MYLVGFIVEIYHDALSHERQKEGYTLRPYTRINPLNPELNPICYLLALLGAHHFSTLAG